MQNAAAFGLADLLLLQQQLRNKSTLNELGYFIVNDSQKIAPYQIAVWYSQFRGIEKIRAISGLPAPVKEAPFFIITTKLCQRLNRQNYSQPYLIQLTDFSDKNPRWPELFPAQLLWLPLMTVDHQSLGGLLLARDSIWREEEIRLLDYWRDAVEHSVELLFHQRRSWWHYFAQIRYSLLALFCIIALFGLTIPFPISVLAPAEIVAKNPFIIRSPLEAVIDKVWVEPNQWIKKNTLLISLDQAALKSRLDVAMQELEIAKAEYRRAEQAAVMDREAASEIPMLGARIEQHNAEVNYVRTLLKRSQIRAPKDGIVIMQDVYELEGKPIKLGERLLTLAQPNQAEIEIWLAVGDSIELSEQAEIELFLNVNPETPYLSQLRYVNFQAEMSPEGIFAFRTRADFIAGENIPRIGLRGTAKLYGQSEPLYYYLFRRPWASVRQWLGW